MSAIFGILAFGGRSPEVGAIEKMAHALSHRAPDGGVQWSSGSIAIGHGLMRVTHEDLFERQPVVEDDLVLAADMRLDNREELAAAIGINPASLAGLPDSALLRGAYLTWGENCVHHLLGDFAFAIWDRRRNQLLLARDHLGQRNCFFHVGTDAFLFASEVKALWSISTVPRELSDATIARWLLNDRSPEASAASYGSIVCLGGGERIIVGADGRVSRETWWRPAADPQHLGRDEAYYVEAYARVLGEAVACRVRRATAPVSLLMSGGYDSTAVAALAAEPLGGRKLLAVASVMSAEYAGDIRHARKWVDICARDMPHLDVRHVSLEGRHLLDGIERRFLHADTCAHPYDFASSTLYATAAAEGARSVLTGYGGEATLNPRGDLIAQLLVERRWRAFLRELRARSRSTRRSLWATLKGEVVAKLLPEVARRWGKRLHVERARPESMNAAFLAEMIGAGAVRTDDLRARRSGRNYLDRRFRTLRRKAAMAARTEMAYMAGLEQSDPFYDKRVVELALAIPTHLFLRNGRERDLACRALAKLYPREFQHRSRLNDDLMPDFLRMLKRIEPELLADLARMERTGRIGRYLDFDGIRRLLAVRGADDHNSGWEQETHLAFEAYMVGRYVEWFRGYR